MSKFDDILNQELPSKREDYSNNDYTYAYDAEECGSCEDVDTSYDEDEERDSIDEEIDDELEDIDLGDLSEDELEEIDEEDLLSADEDEAELDSSEEKEADKIMNLTATPAMLQDEFKDDEQTVEEFAMESYIAVSEGMILEESVDELMSEYSNDNFNVFEEKRVFATKTRIQLNEADRRKQLFEIGVYASARAHNDPVYRKLQKINTLRRAYKAHLRHKYRGEALRRVKAYIMRLKKSSSSVLNKVADKVTGRS
jgi:hypothetical protein|nr:MAG TPA: hypothetical protein [Caudoviricetes sp.]